MSRCPQCGANIKGSVCSYCGYEVPDNTKVVNNVTINNIYNGNNNGSPQQAPSNNVVHVKGVSNKSKMVTLILCIFLGYFGVHKFYVGKTGVGLLYLFTCGLFDIGWFIDIILILCGSFKDANGLPLKN